MNRPKMASIFQNNIFVSLCNQLSNKRIQISTQKTFFVKFQQIFHNLKNFKFRKKNSKLEKIYQKKGGGVKM